jgi:hypothetical protein
MVCTAAACEPLRFLRRLDFFVAMFLSGSWGRSPRFGAQGDLKGLPRVARYICG